MYIYHYVVGVVLETGSRPRSLTGTTHRAPCCTADQMRRPLQQEEREGGARKTSTPGSARMSGQDAACRAGAWGNVKAL